MLLNTRTPGQVSLDSGILARSHQVYGPSVLLLSSILRIATCTEHTIGIPGSQERRQAVMKLQGIRNCTTNPHSHLPVCVSLYANIHYLHTICSLLILYLWRTLTNITDKCKGLQESEQLREIKIKWIVEVDYEQLHKSLCRKNTYSQLCLKPETP